MPGAYNFPELLKPNDTFKMSQKTITDIFRSEDTSTTLKNGDPTRLHGSPHPIFLPTPCYRSSS